MVYVSYSFGMMLSSLRLYYSIIVLKGDYVKTTEVNGRKVLEIDGQGLTLLSEQGMIDIAHLLRPSHLQSLSNILKDPEASNNDKFVALELLKNANIASSMVLPSCQDTGTAIIMGKKGQHVWTNEDDSVALSRGIYNTYTRHNLRYSQVCIYSFTSFYRAS